MPSVVLDRVTRVFRGRGATAVTAVEDLCLEARDGECLALLGPSGSGKTTTLRMIAGVDAPTSGDVRIEGRSQREVPPERRGVAMVFQDHPLLSHLTVLRQMDLVLGFSGGGGDERAKRLEQAVQWLDLGGLLERYPGQLSGGERQRVALALAVLRRAHLLLLDEPFAHVDAPQRSRLRADLLRLRRALGWTVLLVTHDQQEAALLADRVAILNQGRLCQCAPFAELIADPADTRVAGFVGSPPMNLFRGSREQREGSDPVFRSDAGWAWRFPGANRGAAETSTPVVLGLRDRDLRVARREAPKAGSETLPVATVESVHRSEDGKSLTLVLGLDGDTVLIRRTSDDELVQATPGSQLVLHPVEGCDACWFDARSGRRLTVPSVS